MYLSTFRSCFSKPNSASSDKENPLALSASWMSSVCQLLLLSLVSFRPSWCLALLSSTSYNLHCFYGYFWTSWAWNKDAVLLFSIQYCPVKYTKHYHLSRMHAPDNVQQLCELTYVIGHLKTCSHPWNFSTQGFYIGDLSKESFPILGRQKK